MAKEIKTTTRLACPECEQISIRIFDKFLPVNILNPTTYVLLDWLACQNSKCKNYFKKIKTSSRCPVCKLWSLKFSLKAGVRKWSCKNRDCEWSFKF